jgi:hypothetical protein
MLATMSVASQAQRMGTPESGNSSGQLPVPRTSLSSGAFSSVSGPIFREIDDPQSGARWLLLHDLANPGGPGRMVLAGFSREIPSNVVNNAGTAVARESDPVLRAAVIHAGDVLIVEEHSPVADAYLEARALGQARVGSDLAIRLKIGGKVLRAVALGPGRAAVVGEPGVRR